jgi:hypothetical protein
MTISHLINMPRHIAALAGLYLLASLLHFTHNAEYIAYYPNMPASITRENVYLAWLAITSVGVVGFGLAYCGWRLAAAACIAAYGAMGFDGLAHYTLALCSEHTWAMNFTIWFEVATGAMLLASSAWFLKAQIQARARGRHR